MKLHIEGTDAPKLMNLIDGMGTLRITDDHGHCIECEPVPIRKTKFYNRQGKELTASYIVEINLDPRCFRAVDEVVDWEWPQAQSLYCSMSAAMRGLGWSGRERGHNSITVSAFLKVLRKHAHREYFDITYIETA